MKGFEFRSGIESMAHKTCAALGLPAVKVRWTYIPTAAVNAHGDMLLANVADNVTVNKQLISKYSGFVVHELLHRKFTDFSANDGRVYVDQLHNALEDAWIERKAIAMNLTGNIQHLLSTLIDGLADDAMASAADWTDPRMYPFALALWARGFCKRVPVPHNLIPVFNQAAAKLDACLNSTDTLTLARWVFDQINLQAQQQPRQPQPKNGSETAPEGAQSDQSKGEGETEGSTERPVTGTSKAPDENDAANVEPTLTPDASSEQPTFSINDLRKPDYHLRAHITRTLPEFQAGKLRYEVRRLFENSAFDDFAVNRKSGSLNVTALHRINTSDKLFKRHQEHSGIDSAVVLLIDCSGSMSRNERILTAVKTAAALYETLHKAGVAVAVITFSDEVAMPVPFGTPIARAKHLISTIMDGGGTADYEAIRFAHNFLLHRPESRKVCFALTDGDGNPYAAREQIAIGKDLGITTVGIGIQQNVGRVYPENIRVDKLSDLATASFNRIKLAA